MDKLVLPPMDPADWVSRATFSGSGAGSTAAGGSNGRGSRLKVRTRVAS